jgi:cytochrome c-type biogenesis protein CcsB
VPHAAEILGRWATVGHGPYITRFEALSTWSWVAVLFLVGFVARRPSWSAVGVVVMPIAILTIAVGVFCDPGASELPPSVRSTWLVFHVIFANLSAGAFLMSAGTAILLLATRRPRSSGWLSRVPSTDALDAYAFRFAGFGFVFWTVTIAAGAIWGNQLWGRYWGWDPIETWTLVSWIGYGVFLHARRFFKLGPAPSAWANLTAFTVFVLALAVLPMLVRSLHSAYFV